MDILNRAEMRRKDLCAAVDLDLDEDQTCRMPPVKVSSIFQGWQSESGIRNPPVFHKLS